MSDDSLTDQERRNVETARKVIECWTMPGGAKRMVEECYIETPEVFLPLQPLYVSKRGESNADWLAIETELEKLFPRREAHIQKLVARGDTVALEVTHTRVTRDGKAIKGSFAAFFRFDDNGRIVTDHTFRRQVPAPSPEHFPELARIWQRIEAKQ